MASDIRIEGVKVYSYAGEDRGIFDATHIVGSEVIRGTGSETAIDRAFRARNIVELASEGAVSTDSIRYVLDGLRDVKPGDHLSEDEIRQFKHHVKSMAQKPARRAGPLREPDEEPSTKLDLKDTEGEPRHEDGVVLIGNQPDMRTTTGKNCHYVITSRHTVHQPYIEVSPLTIKDTTSEMFLSTQTDRIVEELKVVLEQKLSNEITYNEFGASASLTGTALEQFLRDYVQTHTFVLAHYTTRVSGTIKITVHSKVSNTWAWDGPDCGSSVSPPEVVTYVLKGETLTYEFDYFYETWEKKAQKSWLSGEKWAEKSAQQHVIDLINKGAWMPTDLPLSKDLPTPTNF